jgi:signal transduction histidine kinase
MTQPPSHKNNRILVIDDNQAIHADFKKVLAGSDPLTAGLESAGAELFGEEQRTNLFVTFEVDSAFSGEEGLKSVTEAVAKGRPYALAFVDVRMAPGWDGIETTDRIFKNDSDIQIVICTAYSDYSWEKMIEKLGQSDRLVILKKPFDTIEVLQLAHAMMEKWDLQQKARARTGELENMVAERTHELQIANEHLKQEMEERARTEEALRHAQKMEAVGQLAGGIAHDFNNLLTVIRGYVQCLHSEMNLGASVLEALREIDAAAERAAKLTSQMLMFSRKKQIRPVPMDINELLDRAGAMLRRVLGENIALDVQPAAAPLIVQADPVMIEMAVLNLSVNSRDAMPDGGHLLIRAEQIDIPAAEAGQHAKGRPGMFARLTIQDDGCGIPAEVLPHLFEPFFTTKDVGKGTGLGLASVYGVINQHAGWIEVESELGKGSKFIIFLPTGRANPPPKRLTKPEIEVPHGKETILLVEDESSLRRLAKNVLERHGYHVLEAGSGAEALAVWNKHSAEVNLLITDIIMPGGMSGHVLGAQLLEKMADLKILYTSGYGPDMVGQNPNLEEGVNFLAKPYHPDRLIRTIRRCLENPART